MSETDDIRTTYKLKGGEEWREDGLYGWTGHKCPNCNGTGISRDDDSCFCRNCSGTGEFWGRMPIQPISVTERRNLSAMFQIALRNQPNGPLDHDKAQNAAIQMLLADRHARAMEARTIAVEERDE